MQVDTWVHRTRRRITVDLYVVVMFLGNVPRSGKYGPRIKARVICFFVFWFIITTR